MNPLTVTTPLREQATRLQVPPVGDLTRRRELERARCEQVYTDEAGSAYHVRRGILTVVTAAGAVL